MHKALDVPKVNETGIIMLRLLTIPIAARICSSFCLPATIRLIYQMTSAKTNDKKDGRTICKIVLISDHEFSSLSTPIID